MLRSSEPSPVTLWPPELTPFGVRFHFRPVVDANGHQRELRVGPSWVEPPGNGCYVISAQHDETLHSYLYTYEAIARAYLEGRDDHALRIRRRMLDEMVNDARLRQYESHTRGSMLSWARDYRALGGDRRGVVKDLGELWGVSPRQTRRRLERVEREGLLPEGLPRRKERTQ